MSVDAYRMLAHVADNVGVIEALGEKTAIIVGSAMASFCVEKFGPQRMQELTKEEIDARMDEFVELVNFDIDLVG